MSRSEVFLSRSRVSFVLCATSALCLLSTADALAHRLHLSIDVGEQEIAVRAFYGRRSPCKACQITVTDDAGKEVFSSQTDQGGQATFRPESLDRALGIMAKDAMGHRAQGRVSTAQLKRLEPHARTAETSAEEPSERPEKATHKAPSEAPPSAADHHCKMDQGMIEALVRREVTKHVKASSSAAPRDDPTTSFDIRDVIAGLGFIFGLAGLVVAVTRKSKA